MRRTDRTRAPRGFTLIEAVLSMMIVGVVGVAALSAATQAIKARGAIDDARTGRALAKMMLEEVLGRSYEEPEAGSRNDEIGLDDREDFQGDRHDLDDVDDYNGFATENDDGITDAQGALLEGTRGWRVEVEVTYLNPIDFTPGERDRLVNRQLGLDMKRATVRVSKAGKLVETLSGIATRGWGELQTSTVVPAQEGTRQ